MVSAIEPGALVFAFTAGRLIVHAQDFAIPEAGELREAGELVAGPILLGQLEGRPSYALGLADGIEPGHGLVAIGLRELFARVEGPALVSMAARASQMLDWWVGHRFCGRCGTPTVPHETEMARACPNCSALHYPRINPAVITLVHRGDDVLLAHDHRFPPGFFALVAGFVEAGETLEQAVAREIREEVGIEVDELQYFGSQSWPFPSQLMCGFFARHKEGEIVIQESELSEARWFHRDALPAPDSRPATYSIAGRLLAHWLGDGSVAREADLSRQLDGDDQPAAAGG